MPLSLVTVGAKITATFMNSMVALINRAGSTVVVPVSVAGAGVSLNSTTGVVTITAATTVSLNGCFTTEFDSYVIEFDLTTTSAANVLATLRVAGADSIVGYDNQRLTAINATANPAQTLNTIAAIASVPAVIGRHTGTMKVFGPNTATATTGMIASGVSPNPMTATAGMTHVYFLHRTVGGYDGITFTPSAGTFSGKVTVHGLFRG